MEQEKENSIQLSTVTAPTMKQPRNCAFDIARIVAMFLIVSSHFLGHGGFANNMTGANFVFGRILTSLFNPSVNLFVLIGAYFTCTSKKLKWQRLAKLYAQVWIYSMTLFVVFLCIYGKESFSWNWLLSSLFPVICGYLCQLSHTARLWLQDTFATPHNALSCARHRQSFCLSLSKT